MAGLNKKNNELLFVTESGNAGERVDVFAAERAEITRSRAQKLIESGNATVNEKTVKPNYRLRENDTVRIISPEPEPIDVLAEDVPLDVLYEDAGMIVVNKPRGMVVHPAPGHYGGTLVNALLHRCGAGLSGINGELRPGIVHRLDMETSGAVAVAKNDFYHQKLSEALAKRDMQRIYKAVIIGKITEGEEGVIDTYIGRNPRDRKKMAVLNETEAKNGRRAITRYKALKNYFYKNQAYTFLEASLYTGRTHQIRVHMAHIGRSVAGDPLYGTPRPPFTRLLLHSETIGFAHPETGEFMTVTAPLPEHFIKALQILEGN